MDKGFERPSNRYLEGDFYIVYVRDRVLVLFQKILSLFTIILPVLYNCVMAECFSLICLIKLVMNKDMIFDADGQAAQTELKEMLAKRVSLFVLILQRMFQICIEKSE